MSLSLVLVCILLFVATVNTDEIVCMAPGRYRVRDPACRKYFLCVKQKGSLIARDYVCPENTIFNPSTNRCSMNAICIENICNKLPSSISKIADPNSSDCKTYIECVGTMGNRYPVLKRCDIGYFNKQLLPEPGCWCIPSC